MCVKLTLMMTKPSVRDSPEQWIPTTNVFINYIPKAWTKTDLIDLFHPFGVIESAKVMIDLATGSSRCFGFVRFSSIESAIQAVLSVNGLQVGTKRLLARFAGSVENTGSPTRTIYIKSLPLSMSRKEIWDMYQVFGTIAALDYVVDPQTKRFTGTAYIAYMSVFSAKCAVRETNNLTLTPTSWPLFIRYAEDSHFSARNEEIFHGIVVERPHNSSIAKTPRSAHTYMRPSVSDSDCLKQSWTQAI